MVIHPLHLALDHERLAVPVNVASLEPKQLALAHAGDKRQIKDVLVVMPFNLFEKSLHLVSFC